jgi:hypothetical protein
MGAIETSLEMDFDRNGRTGKYRRQSFRVIFQKGGIKIRSKGTLPPQSGTWANPCREQSAE